MLMLLVFPIFLFAENDPPERKSSIKYEAGNAITYSFSGGRFGDNLLAYFHAKWIAMKYEIPFFYKPFPLSELLQMDTRDVRWSQSYRFKHKVIIRHENEIKKSASSTLYIIPFFPEFKFEFLNQWKGKLYFEVEWEDPIFKEELIQCMTSKEPIPTIPLPQDRKTVGMHVRRGGGYDHKDAMINSPLKFPPDSYYIECLSLLLEIFKNERLYVYLLTDDPHPEKLVSQYKGYFAEYGNVEFACRETGNHYNSNILIDFFTIPKFDCFIGSGSNFSLMAKQLGNYEIEIFPAHAKTVNGVVTIDQIDVRSSR